MTQRKPRGPEYIGDLLERGCDITLLPEKRECKRCGERLVWDFNVRLNRNSKTEEGLFKPHFHSFCRDCEHDRRVRFLRPEQESIDNTLWDALTKVAQARSTTATALAEVAIRAWLEVQYKKAQDDLVRRKARELTAARQRSRV